MPKFHMGQNLTLDKNGPVTVLEVKENFGGFSDHRYCVYPSKGGQVVVVKEDQLRLPGPDPWWVVCKWELVLVAVSLLIAGVIAYVLR